jgi:TetR/AcrR family transcriptional regulator, tetracycline repressor protein
VTITAKPSAPKHSASDETARSLSRDMIIDRAVAIADADGLEAVSIRRLGQEFGVTPMALYWHVRNKDELLAAMGDRLFAGIVVPPLDEPWEQRLRDLFTGLLVGLRRHPALLPLAFPRVMQCPDGLALTDAALQILRDGGFSVRESANIAAHTLRTAIGLVQDEPGTESGVPDPVVEETRRTKRAYLSTLPPDLYPRVIEATDDLIGCDDRPEYDLLGIDLFIAGVQALAAR